MPRIDDDELTTDRINQEIDQVRAAGPKAEAVLTLDAPLGFRFGIRIVNRGKRKPSAQWFYQEGKNNGQKKTLKPGYPYLDKTMALQKAFELARQLEQGEALRAKPAPATRTLKAAVRAYLEDRGRDLGASALSQHKRSCQRLLRFLGPKVDIDKITDQDVLAFTSRVARDHGTASGNLANIAVKGLFRWAKKQGLTLNNPCGELEHFKQTKEEVKNQRTKRPFFSKELEAYWKFWTNNQHHRDATAAALKLTVLTGQRPGTEVLEMRKKHLTQDLPASVLERTDATPPALQGGVWWQIPETKNHHEHLVYLSPRILKIIQPLTEQCKPNDYVFYSTRSGGFGKQMHINYRTVQRLAAETVEAFPGFPPWSFGLTSRRSLNTWLAKSKCPDDVQAAMCNHRTHFSFSKKTYSCWDYLPERVEWFTRYSDHILDLVGEP